MCGVDVSYALSSPLDLVAGRLGPPAKATNCFWAEPVLPDAIDVGVARGPQPIRGDRFLRVAVIGRHAPWYQVRLTTLSKTVAMGKPWHVPINSTASASTILQHLRLRFCKRTHLLAHSTACRPGHDRQTYSGRGSCLGFGLAGLGLLASPKCMFLIVSQLCQTGQKQRRNLCFSFTPGGVREECAGGHKVVAKPTLANRQSTLWPRVPLDEEGYNKPM